MTASRWPCLLGAAAALVVVLTVLGTHPLGYDIEESDYAMLYDRYGFAVLSIVWLEAFAEPKTSSRRADVLGGLSTEAAVGLNFALKLQARAATRPGGTTGTRTTRTARSVREIPPTICFRR